MKSFLQDPNTCQHTIDQRVAFKSGYQEPMIVCLTCGQSEYGPIFPEPPANDNLPSPF